MKSFNEFLDEAKKGVTDKKFGKPEPDSKSGFKKGQRVAHYRGAGKTLHGDVVNPDTVSGGSKGAMVKFEHGTEFVPHKDLKDASQYWKDADEKMRAQRMKEDADCRVCGQTPCNCTFIEESHMSEVHASIAGHVDRHVKAFKQGKLGMDQFGSKITAAHKKVAAEHGIEHNHAVKLVNDYVDSALNEEVDEAHDPLRAAARRISKKLTPPKPADIVNFEKSVASVRKSYKNFKVPSQPTHTNEEVELDEGKIDKNHPIVKEYDSMKKHDIKTLRGMVKQQQRIVDTSEYRTKDHAISAYLRHKHGNKKVDQAFGFNEEAELVEAIKGWKHAHSDIMRNRAAQSAADNEVALHSLKKDGSESGMHDARKTFRSEEEAREYHKRVRGLNPNRNIRHNLYINGKHSETLGEEVELNEAKVATFSTKDYNGNEYNFHVFDRNGKHGYVIKGKHADFHPNVAFKSGAGGDRDAEAHAKKVVDLVAAGKHKEALAHLNAHGKTNWAQTHKESVEQIDEISTRKLALAADAAADPDSGYGSNKYHDPQKFADYAKKHKDAKSAAAVQGAADGKGHYPRDNHVSGHDSMGFRKNRSTNPAMVTKAGKLTKTAQQGLKTQLRSEEIEEELTEANFAATMKKAIAAHERGDHARAKYHLDNAKTARYSMKSTEISKHKDLLDKYKELRDMHEEFDLYEAEGVHTHANARGLVSKMEKGNKLSSPEKQHGGAVTRSWSDKPLSSETVRALRSHGHQVRRQDNGHVISTFKGEHGEKLRQSERHDTKDLEEQFEFVTEQFSTKDDAVNYAKQKVKSYRDSDDGVEIYHRDGKYHVNHTSNSAGRDSLRKSGAKHVTTVYEEVEQIEEVSTSLAGKVLAARQKKLEKMRDEKGSIAATKTPEYKKELSKAQKTGAIISKRRTAEIHKKVASMSKDDWDKLNKGYEKDAEETRKKGQSND